MGWGVPCLTVVENASQGTLGKSEFYRKLEAAIEQGMTGLDCIFNLI